METNVMQSGGHAYNLILKGTSNIYIVVFFNEVLNKRDADIKISYENGVISENDMNIR